MKTGFGRHYMADLYLCQNAGWESPADLEIAVNRLATASGMEKISWSFETFDPNGIRISGKFSDSSYILIQVFPDQNFLAVDLFSWLPQLDLQTFGEGLSNYFLSPQVIAAETRIRAEHLFNNN